MKIRIIKGNYGLRGQYGVRTVMRGQTCDVDGIEAGRLAGLGVAEIVGNVKTADKYGEQEAEIDSEDSDDGKANGAPEAPAVTHLDADQLAGMTVAQLKEMAHDMGIDVSDLKKKADLIDAICREEVIPGGKVSDVPDLGAEAPVV